MAGAAGGVAAMAMRRVSDEQVAAWVERTTFEQGVEAKVADPQTVADVVALLREGRTPELVRDAKAG